MKLNRKHLRKMILQEIKRQLHEADSDGDGTKDYDELMNIARNMKQNQAGGTSDSPEELRAKQIVSRYDIEAHQGDEGNFIDDIASFIKRNPQVSDEKIADIYEEGGISDDDPDSYYYKPNVKYS